jgi:uncharacterized protein (TIGR00369 family)
MDKKIILDKINTANKNTLMETLDIEYVDIGEDFLVARMPVTSKVYQPDGVLHGGATVALQNQLEVLYPICQLTTRIKLLEE